MCVDSRRRRGRRIFYNAGQARLRGVDLHDGMIRTPCERRSDMVRQNWACWAADVEFRTDGAPNPVEHSTRKYRKADEFTMCTSPLP